MMRIAFACVMQESNSFAPAGSELDDFEIEMGDAITSTYRGTNTEVGGFLAELERLGITGIPLLSAFAIASGPVRDEAFASISNLLTERISKSRFDGLLIALHGAWLGESCASADAELLKRIRKIIGQTTPLVASLDFHANVGPALLSEVDAVVGYRTYPHTDMGETGRKAVCLLHEIISSGMRPYTYWLALPLLAAPQRATTDLSPIRGTMASLDYHFQSALSSSFFCVQPWLDIPNLASSQIVVTQRSDEEIPRKMQKIANELWARRSELEPEWVEPGDLIERVLREPRGPVIISEAFDGTTGGAPGENPGLLRILMPHKEHISGCLFIADPEAAGEASRLGVGQTLRCALGARKDTRFGSPVPVEGQITHISDGKWVLKGPVFTGKKVEMGPTAVLETGRLRVVIGSKPVTMVDPELYRSQGIEPRDQLLVAVKSPTLFRPGYASMLGRVLHLDMPGVCRGNLKKVPFSKVNRPIYPLDDFAWAADDKAVRRIYPLHSEFQS